MLRLRDSVVYTTPQAIASAFTGFHLGANVEQDGVNMGKKVAVIKVVTNPAVDETIVVGGKTYTFKATALTTSQITIGNLIANGDFAAGNNGAWQGRNWTVGATGALHVAGTPIVGDPNAVPVVHANSFVQALEQQMFPLPTVGGSYVTGFTVGGRTAGSVKIKIGGVLGSARSTNATFAETLVATSNETIQFVPSADFDGKISAVTVTNVAADLKTLTAKAICDRVNLDKVAALCTAYQGLNSLGLTTEVAFVANDIGVTPTLTVDTVKITKPIAFALVITEAQLENTDYFKKNIATEADVKPIVLVERNSGTDRNFLY